jgi:hypothetical protein
VFYLPFAFFVCYLVTNGGWSDWEPWGICTVTCDYGIISRRRNCSSPTPSLGGQYCNGDASEYQICKSKPCSGKDGTIQCNHISVLRNALCCLVFVNSCKIEF